MNPFKTKTSGGLRGVDREEVRRALSVLADPDHAIELRGLPSGRSRVRLGNQLDELVEAANELSDDRGIYWTLNPLTMLAGFDRAAKDVDVLRRRWLLVDIDAGQPRDQNASDQEKEQAKDIAGQILDWLTRRGWPLPVFVDSGNGWHLLYRVDLPNDADARQLIKDVLYKLAGRFDSICPPVHVDRSVHNASRISKLPGTWARKGPMTDDRPHRMARFQHVPEPVEVVTHEQLYAVAHPAGDAETVVDMLLPLASEGPAESEGHATNGRHRIGGGNPFRQKTTGAAGPDVWTRATAYVHECGPAVSGAGGHPQTMSVARGVVWGFGLGAEEGYRLLQECYNPRCQPPWSERELRHKCEDAERTPDPKGRPWGYLLEESRARTPDSNGRADSGTSEVVIHTLADIMRMELPEPRWAVPGILSEGLSILAGKPKLGKSFVALNLGITIAAGGKALGSISVAPGDVLYLSLEDRLRRVQDRARKILAGLRIEASRRLFICVACPRMPQGLEILERWIESVPRPSLIIVDVWAKFRPMFKGQASAYEQDYEAASALKTVADRGGLSALILHHCKKAASEDVVDEISGTLGLAGAADGTTILSRARSENEATLFISGRDVQEAEMALTFDPKSCVWTSSGSAEDRTRSRVRLAILALFKANGGAALFPGEMAELIERSNPESVRKEAWRMCQDGILRRVGKKYSWPNEGPDGEGEV